MSKRKCIAMWEEGWWWYFLIYRDGLLYLYVCEKDEDTGRWFCEKEPSEVYAPIPKNIFEKQKSRLHARRVLGDVEMYWFVVDEGEPRFVVWNGVAYTWETDLWKYSPLCKKLQERYAIRCSS